MAGISDNPYILDMLKKQNEAFNAGSQGAGEAISIKNAKELTNLKDLLQGKAQTRNASLAQDLFNENKGKGGGSVSATDSGVTINAKEIDPTKAMMFNQTQANKLTERYGKVGGFNSALQDVEKLTNRDGKGGVLSNADAQLISTGKILSKVPTTALGLAELAGQAPQGTSEERKALERVQLEYQKSMTGVRTSDKMAQREKQAMGWMASGDPALVAKGVRSLANNVKNNLQTSQAGFSPQVRDQVHSSMGDPMDYYKNLVDDSSLAQQARAKTAIDSAPLAPAATPGPLQQATQPAAKPSGSYQEEMAKRGLKF